MLQLTNNRSVIVIFTEVTRSGVGAQADCWVFQVTVATNCVATVLLPA
jgi:hypothetical protein